MNIHYPPCDHCGNAVQIYRTDAVGRLILDTVGRPILKPGPTPRYCSDAHKKRAQRRMPNVRSTRKPRKQAATHTDLDFPKPKFRPSWVPKHPVDDPVCGECGSCGAPLYRNGQQWCPGSGPCRFEVLRKERIRKGQDEEHARLARGRIQTLKNDAIDRCTKCDDNGILPSGVEHWHPIG